MKMKNLFSHRSKKKRHTRSTSYVDNIGSETSKSSPTNEETNNEDRSYQTPSTDYDHDEQRPPSIIADDKNSSAVSSADVNFTEHVLLGNRGTHQVLVGSNTLPYGGVNNKMFSYKDRLRARIPGSESSSRTASSASSNSAASSRSTRFRNRPWSVVVAFKSDDTLNEALNESNSHLSLNNIPTSSSSAALCHPEPSVVDKNISKGVQKFNGLLNLFRRFRRRSTTESSRSKNQSLLSNERSSFRSKNNRKGKERSSFGKKSLKASKSESLELSCQSEAFSDSVTLMPSEEIVTESKEESSPPPASSSSKVQVPNVLILPSKHTTDEQPTSSNFPQFCKNDGCRCLPQFRTRSRSNLVTSESTSTIGSHHSEAALFVPRSIRRRPYSSSFTLSPLECVPEGVPDTITNSSQHYSYELGGSLKYLSAAVPPTTSTSNCKCPSSRESNTVPQCSLRSTKLNQNVYASSPQLSNEDNRRTLMKKPFKKKKSIKRQPSVEAIDEQHVCSSSSSSIKEVDSPTKRAIAFPVVMRRKYGGMVSSSRLRDPQFAGNCSLRSLRSKQSMSLNMDDLPTYERLKEENYIQSAAAKEVLWRRSFIAGSSEFTYNNSSLSKHQMSTCMSRLAELLRQSSNSNLTDFENFDEIHQKFSNYNMENILGMDDDEFLNFVIECSDPQTPTSIHVHSKLQEPNTKRPRPIRKSVASFANFANLISPNKPGRSKLQRSSSYKENPQRGSVVKAYCPPGERNGVGSAGGKRGGGNAVNTSGQRSKLWCEIFECKDLTSDEVKRQEAVYELYQGERDIFSDLGMAKKNFRDPMFLLKYLTEQEVATIFGRLDSILPIHEQLIKRIEEMRSEKGRIYTLGRVLIDWLPSMSVYKEYCVNQTTAKEMLDVVQRRPKVAQYLERCINSPFSRKLNLWSHLDLPRSRLFKYPLLLKNIIKTTPEDDEDIPYLQKALTKFDGIIKEIDSLTGERNFRQIVEKFDFSEKMDDEKRNKALDGSTTLIFSGQLKASKGTKLTVYLFDRVLVLTRVLTRSDNAVYQVYRQPVPLNTLSIKNEEATKGSGSFRGGLRSSDKTIKHSFKVRSEEKNVTYTLVATDEHDRKVWINSIQDAINKLKPKELAHKKEETSTSNTEPTKKSNKSAAIRRSSSVVQTTPRPTSMSRARSQTVNTKSFNETPSCSTTPTSADHRMKGSRSSSPVQPLLRKITSRSRSKLTKEKQQQATNNVDVIPFADDLTDSPSLHRRSRSLTSSPVPPESKPTEDSTKTRFRSESCIVNNKGKPRASGSRFFKRLTPRRSVSFRSQTSSTSGEMGNLSRECSFGSRSSCGGASSSIKTVRSEKSDAWVSNEELVSSCDEKTTTAPQEISELVVVDDQVGSSCAVEEDEHKEEDVVGEDETTTMTSLNNSSINNDINVEQELLLELVDKVCLEIDENDQPPQL